MPLPAEHRGKVRLFYQKIRMIYRQHPLDGGAAAALDYLSGVTRTCRHNIAWALPTAALRWRDALPADAAVTFEEPVPLEDADGWRITELTAVASELQMPEWPDLAWEPGIDVLQVQLVVKRPRPRARYTTAISWRHLATISSHALGRRLERGGGSVEQAVLEAERAIQPIRSVASCPAVATPGGKYLVRPIRLSGDTVVGAARTWLPETPLSAD